MENDLRKYHHLGIPTHVRREGEAYLEQFKVHVVGYEKSPYGIEWMRYEPGSSLRRTGFGVRESVIGEKKNKSGVSVDFSRIPIPETHEGVR
jgi:hypothetical protein